MEIELRKHLSRFALLVLFTVLGFAVMGYHPGLEDDGIYLTAVKADLDPSLYRFNSGFFRLQLEATGFDDVLAAFVRLTHMSVAWAELFWQLVSLLVALGACYRIACALFPESYARWGAVAMVSAMFTLPVAGTALFLMDQHLHARNVATALILLALAQILDGRGWQAAGWLMVAFHFHPLMAALGISFSIILAATLHETAPAGELERSTAAVLPLGWVFEPANTGWRRALDMHTYYYLFRWSWYEWLGALAPLLLFWLLSRMARDRGQVRLSRFALAVFAYGVFHGTLAVMMLAPSALVRLTPLQPMRYLQLVYYFLALVAGGLLGRYALEARAWRWAIFLVAADLGMGFAQCRQFPASPHLELPGLAPANPWLQAFAWIQTNTPTDAYFALDPEYMAIAGEDYHSFRALAERSQLADAIKDSATVTQVPELGPEWDRQYSAEQGWRSFKLTDFERLKREFGVNWLLLGRGQTAGLDCRWHNASLAVCVIP